MEYNPNPNTRPGYSPVFSWGHPKIPKQKAIAIYTLGADRQNPLAGAAHNAVFNTVRRCRGQFWFVVPPFVVAYWLMGWAEERNRFENSKEGRMRAEEREREVEERKEREREMEREKEKKKGSE